VLSLLRGKKKNYYSDRAFTTAGKSQGVARARPWKDEKAVIERIGRIT